MVARKTAAKSASARKPAAKRASAETSAGEEAKRPAAKKAAPKKAAPKKAAEKKPAAEKAASAKAPAKKKPAKKAPARKTQAKKTGAQKVAAKKTPAAKPEAVPTARSAQAAPATPEELPVRPGEDPWTREEVAEARETLQGEAERIRSEIETSEEALTGLMRDSGDSAGDDDADTGSKNITREHEMALAANAREMLYQTGHALERIEAGTYGLCENCGKPIGKARMQAFPRATLCVECKQRQERR